MSTMSKLPCVTARSADQAEAIIRRAYELNIGRVGAPMTRMIEYVRRDFEQSGYAVIDLYWQGSEYDPYWRQYHKGDR